MSLKEIMRSFIFTGPVIELEELDDQYFDTDDGSGADENLSSEEFASSEWASMMVPEQVEPSQWLIVANRK